MNQNQIQTLNGVLLVDKSSGVTSHDVVDDLRRALKIRAVGHGGTLDPLATGLLVCLVGDATKLSSFVMSEDKSYLVGVRLGVKTDSGDMTGKILAEKDATPLTGPEVAQAVNDLIGALELQVPRLSAVKVKGKKLYEYAREDVAVDLPTKTMTIHKVTLIDFKPGHLVLEMDCEKGTYVRSWVEKLGENLGCGATVESLRRLRSGPFHVDQSHKIEFFQENPDAHLDAMVPMAHVLGTWPALKVVGFELALLRNGQIPKGVFSQLHHVPWDAGVRLLDDRGALAALAIKDQQKGVKLARVFGVGARS